MKQTSALIIAMDAIRHLRNEHNYSFNCEVMYDRAIEILQAMQAGLDGECDVLARDWDTPEEDAAWKDL